MYTWHESVQEDMRTQLYTLTRRSHGIKNTAAFKCKLVTGELSIHEDLWNSVTDVVITYVDMNVYGAQESRLRTTSHKDVVIRMHNDVTKGEVTSPPPV